MPRRKAGARLYLDPRRKQWIIRDGTHFVRTGCLERDHAKAEKALASYIGRKHAPAPSNNPTIDEVLAAYGTEHAPHTARPADTGYANGNLIAFWGGKRVSDVTARNCRAYTASKRPGGARRDLETLRAAVNHWHREYGPLSSVPAFTLPARGEPRDRWLTRSEAAALLRAARRTEHLKRFILIGLYTGSRAGVIYSLRWDWIDFERGVMRRREPGEADKKTKRRPAVKLGKLILRHLARWRRADGDGEIFVVRWGDRPIHRLRRSWGEACRRAGLKGVVPHTLRHTRATWLMHAGVPIWEAASYLGMTVAVLERVYGHGSPDWQSGPANV